MNSRAFVWIAVVVVSVGLAGRSVIGAQKTVPNDKEFAAQWTEVKKKYPLVAMAYLRREAFVRALSASTQSFSYPKEIRFRVSDM